MSGAGLPVLVDTSSWVEFDRATGSAVHHRVRELLAVDGAVATTEPVVMEVLAGARDDDRERALRRLLRRAQLVAVDPVSDFEAAARIYRLCRDAGVTPRGLIDCMIVAVASRNAIAVLAHDRDFARIAEVIALELDDASLRPEGQQP